VDGFDYGILRFHELECDTVRSLALVRLRTITTMNGDVLDGAAIGTAVTSRKIPHQSCLVLETTEVHDREAAIPLDEIDLVMVRDTKYGALTGLAAGLAIDVAVVAILYGLMVASLVASLQGTW
jgi:hypothetical protein